VSCAAAGALEIVCMIISSLTMFPVADSTSGRIVCVVGRASLQCWRDKPHSARLENQAEVLLWLRDERGDDRLKV
jgi:hypothetical protein